MRTYRTVDVSAVILNQNQGIFLERCIRSCLSQTFPGRFFEVLVVDAASTDFSREVIHSYGRRIQTLFLESPATLEEAAVAGIRRANNGRYTVLVRAQDFLSDYMLLFQAIWLFQNHDYEGVGVDYWLVDQGTDTKLRRVSGQEFLTPFGTMYRKEVFVREGLYEASYGGRTLPLLQSDSLRKYPTGHINIPFYRYQQDAGRLAEKMPTGSRADEST